MPILLTLTNDVNVDAELRIRAANDLGELGRGEEVASALLSLVYDRNASLEIRTEAVSMMGNLGHIDDLVKVVQNKRINVWVRASVPSELGRLGQVDKLLAILNDTEEYPMMHIEAAGSMAKLGYVDEMVPRLITIAQEIGEDDGWECYRAAAVLGELDRSADLLSLAHDPVLSAKRRVEIIRVLAKLNDANVIPALEQLARSEPDGEVCRTAQEELDRIREGM